MIEVVQNFWILEDKEQPVGLFFSIGDEFVYFSNGAEEKFNSFDDFMHRIGAKRETIIFEEEETRNPKQVDGYPVKIEHEVVFLEDNNKFSEDEKKEILSLGYPVYTRGTEVVFVAGYWTILRETEQGIVWNVVFCPKLETILKAKHSGPYKTRAMAQQEATLLQKKEKRKIKNS